MKDRVSRGGGQAGDSRSGGPQQEVDALRARGPQVQVHVQVLVRIRVPIPPRSRWGCGYGHEHEHEHEHRRARPQERRGANCARARGPCGVHGRRAHAHPDHRPPWDTTEIGVKNIRATCALFTRPPPPPPLSGHTVNVGSVSTPYVRRRRSSQALSVPVDSGQVLDKGTAAQTPLLQHLPGMLVDGMRPLAPVAKHAVAADVMRAQVQLGAARPEDLWIMVFL
ncbi:hypothetical protein CRUP_017316 [Coryphaenoides rupestris]|nr:hypothetical protein CRUP_017316 [Coryphaenoides rupestris]